MAMDLRDEQSANATTLIVNNEVGMIIDLRELQE